MNTIYIVEDEENISELVSYALKGSGFNTVICGDSKELYIALDNKELTNPDLILLDVMLPDEDGLSILKNLKSSAKWKNFPVIMLTAKSNEMDKVRGLDLGADDYITKPFSVLELTSRIQAVLRRSKKEVKKQLVFNTIVIDTEKHIVTVDEKEIELTLKEFELLCYFIENTEIALSREKIISVVWKYDYGSESRTVDAHIKSLRQKIGEAGKYIQTVRGVGYKISLAL